MADPSLFGHREDPMHEIKESQSVSADDNAAKIADDDNDSLCGGDDNAADVSQPDSEALSTQTVSTGTHPSPAAATRPPAPPAPPAPRAPPAPPEPPAPPAPDKDADGGFQAGPPPPALPTKLLWKALPLTENDAAEKDARQPPPPPLPTKLLWKALPLSENDAAEKDARQPPPPPLPTKLLWKALPLSENSQGNALIACTDTDSQVQNGHSPTRAVTHLSTIGISAPDCDVDQPIAYVSIDTRADHNHGAYNHSNLDVAEGKKTAVVPTDMSSMPIFVEPATAAPTAAPPPPGLPSKLLWKSLPIALAVPALQTSTPQLIVAEIDRGTAWSLPTPPFSEHSSGATSQTSETPSELTEAHTLDKVVSQSNPASPLREQIQAALVDAVVCIDREESLLSTLHSTIKSSLQPISSPTQTDALKQSNIVQSVTHTTSPPPPAPPPPPSTAVWKSLGTAKGPVPKAFLTPAVSTVTMLQTPAAADTQALDSKESHNVSTPKVGNDAVSALTAALTEVLSIQRQQSEAVFTSNVQPGPVRLVTVGCQATRHGHMCDAWVQCDVYHALHTADDERARAMDALAGEKARNQALSERLQVMEVRATALHEALVSAGKVAMEAAESERRSMTIAADETAHNRRVAEDAREQAEIALNARQLAHAEAVVALAQLEEFKEKATAAETATAEANAELNEERRTVAMLQAKLSRLENEHQIHIHGTGLGATTSVSATQQSEVIASPTTPLAVHMNAVSSPQVAARSEPVTRSTAVQLAASPSINAAQQRQRDHSPVVGSLDPSQLLHPEEAPLAKRLLEWMSPSQVADVTMALSPQRHGTGISLTLGHGLNASHGFGYTPVAAAALIEAAANATARRVGQSSTLSPGSPRTTHGVLASKNSFPLKGNTLDPRESDNAPDYEPEAGPLTAAAVAARSIRDDIDALRDRLRGARSPTKPISLPTGELDGDAPRGSVPNRQKRDHYGDSRRSEPTRAQHYDDLVPGHADSADKRASTDSASSVSRSGNRPQRDAQDVLSMRGRHVKWANDEEQRRSEEAQIELQRGRTFETYLAILESEQQRQHPHQTHNLNVRHTTRSRSPRRSASPPRPAWSP